MNKLFKTILMIVTSIKGVFIFLVLFSAIIYSPEYMYRIIVNGESKVTDHAFFPKQVIEKSPIPYKYTYDLDNSLDMLNIIYEIKGRKSAPLLSVLKDNDTTSLIVIHNDVVKYEKYFNGYRKDSINTSFSSVKSLVSLLIGMAIQDGYIKSENQKISEFIPEFINTDFEEITIKDLLMMRSNIRYEEELAWFSDAAKTYYMPDLRNLALHHMSIDANYSGQFHYNNYHPLLLGIILERSTKQQVAHYFQEKIWKKVGTEYNASWSIDSDETQFEKMESGLNFVPIDYAKIGSMLLHNGTWNGQDIVNKNWISVSTIAPAPLSESDIDSEFLKDKTVGYQYMWYSIKNDKGGHDYFAAGKYGQYLYISPENKVVIVRTGITGGNIDWWPDVLKQIASNIAN